MTARLCDHCGLSWNIHVCLCKHNGYYIILKNSKLIFILMWLTALHHYLIFDWCNALQPTGICIKHTSSPQWWRRQDSPLSFNNNCQFDKNYFVRDVLKLKTLVPQCLNTGNVHAPQQYTIIYKLFFVSCVFTIGRHNTRDLSIFRAKDCTQDIIACASKLSRVKCRQHRRCNSS